MSNEYQRRPAAAQRSPAADPAQRAGHRAPAALDGSPRAALQREKLGASFGPSLQRVEDEEPLQGAGLDDEQALQGAGLEEEEPLQGAQMEDEEPLQGAGLEDEEPMQGAGLEDEEPLQGKSDPPNRTGMPDGLKAGIEQLSGMDLSDVRVHANSAQPATVQAQAYAQGNDIHLGPGQERHLPHEAWHVVQQRQGRVAPTMETSAGVPVNDDPGLENEADTMGQKALNRR